MVEKTKPTKGLLIVFTGNAKGKTTAALGMVLRAWGHGLRTCVIQFIKAEGGQWGEVKAAENLGVEWHTTGDGFTWLSDDLGETAEKAKAGWRLAQEKILSGEYNLLVLDEITYCLNFGWIKVDELLAWLHIHRSPDLTVVITGRDAPQPLITAADLVTEMQLVKHPFEAGIPAQIGIDY